VLTSECDECFRAAVVSGVTEPDAETGHVSIGFEIEPSPPSRLGAIVGDIAHNLRSSLDVAAWQLALAKDETAARRQPYKIDFPLAETAERFRKHKLRDFVSDRAWLLIERLQPYQPSMEALGWLRHLSNSDKHRIATFSFAGMTMNPAGQQVGVSSFSSPHLLFGADGGHIGVTGLHAIASAVEFALHELEDFTTNGS
jgi:hypothetical protein